MPLIPSVTPEGLRVIALLLVGMSALAIAVHVLMLAVAARRAALSPRAQAAVPLVGAVLLALWFGWAEGAALYHAAIPPPPPGDLRPAIPVLLAMLGFVVAGTLVLYGSRTMRSVNAAMPSWWLIAAQTYRVAGLMFIWPFMAVGDLPAGFALPAGIGDFLVGAAAPFVAAAVARRRPNARRLATIWNWVGLADLIVAPAAAVLTQAPVVSIYPLGLVPLFLGPPLGILTHIASLRNLAVAGKTEPPTPGSQHRVPRFPFPPNQKPSPGPRRQHRHGLERHACRQSAQRFKEPLTRARMNQTRRGIPAAKRTDASSSMSNPLPGSSG